jgi:hypothetical protein
LKWSVPFISLSFLDYLFQYLSPIGRLYLAEKEVHEIPPCVLVQFVVQSSELLSSKIGESPIEGNTEVIEEIKESSTPYSIENEPNK